MGLLKSVGDFLFGKDPDIFDDKGNVLHKLPKKKWDQWADRMKTSPDYNWRNHSGTAAGSQSNPKKSPSKS